MPKDNVTEQARDVLSTTLKSLDLYVTWGDIDAILAALAAAGLVIEQGWQTIDTAPKEACTEWKSVLVMTSMGVDLGWWSDAVESAPQQPSLSAGWWSLSGETFPGSPDCGDEPTGQPTHWRPKPEPIFLNECETSPASPSPAADHEPEAADPYDATMAAASEYGEPKGPSSR